MVWLGLFQVAAAQQAEQLVLVFGIDSTVEKEGHDRTNITLPGQQPTLLSALLGAERGGFCLSPHCLKSVLSLSWQTILLQHMKPQKNFVRFLHAALKKPAVLVLVNGGVLGIEDYVDDVGAIVEVFRPGAEGGSALAELLVGQANRCKPMQNYRAD